MKKLVLVLLVAMLSVPAFAAPVIDLVNTAGSTTVALNYVADGNLISGMGLKVTITGATVASFTNGATKYWVHPSNIQIDGETVIEGSPVVGANPVGLSEFTVEYGALYDRADENDGNKPGTSGTLCTFTVSGACTVAVTSNTVQGGVVTEDLTAFTALTDSVTVTSNPLAGTIWDPTWCTGQAIGDSNCDGAINFIDLNNLKSSIFKACGAVGYKYGADFNHDKSVNFIDLNILKANIFKTGYTNHSTSAPNPATCP